MAHSTRERGTGFPVFTLAALLYTPPAALPLGIGAAAAGVLAVAIYLARLVSMNR